MSLDDIDKKFIEASIQKSVKKSVDENMEGIAETVTKGLQEKTNVAKQLQNLKNQKQEKKDKEDLLNALLERDKKGEATLAQKFEMLKLTIDKSIPDDFKEGSAALGKSLKGGASQAGRGLAHLNERLMMSNPITAMLYQNRDLLGAGWDIAAGTLKMGWGAAQGIGRGAASVLNSAVNLFKKKNQKAVEEGEEEKPQIEETPTGNYTPKEENNVEGEKSTAEKINEIHEWIFKDFAKFNQEQDKEQKTNNSILSKGLSGLGKTMQSISGIMEVLQAKQKLIVGGLTIGVLAIVALAAWIKNKFGEGASLNPMEHVINQSFDNRDKNQREAFKIDSQGSALSTVTGKNQQALFKKKPEMLNGIANTDIKKSKALDSNGNEINLTKMNFSVGKLTPVLAPYDGMVNSLNKLTNKSQGQVVNTRWVMVISAVDNKSYPAITLRNLISPQLKPQENFKKGDILAYATEDFSMENTWGYEDAKMDNLKDYQNFVNEAKSKNYEDNLQRLADTKDNKQIENLKDFMFKKERASYDLQNKDHKGDWWGKVGEKTHDLFHGKNEDIQRNRYEAEQAKATTEFLDQYNNFGKVKPEEAVIPTPTYTEKSVNAEKVGEQQNQLKEQDEAQKKSSLPQPVKEDKTAQSSSPIIAAIPQELGGMQPPDYLNLSQWNVGFQDNNINIAHG